MIKARRQKCIQCGRPVPGLHSTYNFDLRGVDMRRMDPDRLFCTMRCAATYGVRAASARQR